MSARQGGSLATLLLVIPLSAIPLMAIFGIPEFSHLSASTSETPSDLVRQPVDSFSFFEEPSSASTNAHERNRRAASDLLSPAPGSAQTPQRPARQGEDAWWGDTTAATTGETPAATTPAPARSERTQPSPRPMQTAAPQPLIRTLEGADATPAPTASAGGLTWREATRKLEEVGITDYRLERGESSDRFLFVCRFSPGGDPRIVQRFESEAAEPLAAVEDVLAQVDQWLQHRFADSRRWLP
jgi:hypothetical protein